jgi:hypothetical protein
LPGISPRVQPKRGSSSGNNAFASRTGPFGSSSYKLPLRGGTLGSYPTGCCAARDCPVPVHASVAGISPLRAPLERGTPCSCSRSRLTPRLPPGGGNRRSRFHSTDRLDSPPRAFPPTRSPASRESDRGCKRRVDDKGRPRPCPANEPGRGGSLPASNRLWVYFQHARIDTSPANARCRSDDRHLATDFDRGRSHWAGSVPRSFAG